ncbi:MAG: hypothetical protein JNM72_09710 [Deltaproteobacteria bacterium]|nr:hypothetical protein [Deltaproteobacteria bacterium]
MKRAKPLLTPWVQAGALGGALAWAACPAFAAPTLTVDTPQAPVVVDREHTVHLLLFDEGRPLGQLPGPVWFSAGELRGPPLPLGQGRWAVRWLPPTTSGPVVVEVGPTRAELEVVLHAPPAARLAVRGAYTALSREPLEVLVELGPGGRPEDLVLAVSEGQLSPAAPSGEGEGLRVLWTPDPTPFARPAVIAAVDRRAPGAAPAVAVVSVRARPSVPVQTEPGVQVELEVGRRKYGPVVAGPDGIARAQVEVRPGETVATVTLRDPEGRSATSALPLAGDQRPVAVALAGGLHARDETAPLGWLAAVGPDGAPWSGELPSCARSDRAQLAVRPVSAGLWAVTGPTPAPEDPGDLRIDCGLGVRARASALIPRVTDLPARVLLRMNPSELEADAPFGLVVATVETAAGDRLPVDPLKLSAAYGVLEPRIEGLALRAAYDGRAALAQGGDELRATLTGGVGQGSVAHVDLDVGLDATGVLYLRVRPRAWSGARLAGVRLELTLPGGLRQTGQSSEDGEWAIPLIAGAVPPMTITVGAPGLQQSRMLAWDPAAPLTLAAGELSAVLPVPVFSGRVRSVFISSEPRTVELGPNAQAEVRVRLVDAAGNPVDAPVELRASHGRIGEARRRVDGSYEAIFSPGEEFVSPVVQITAASPTGAFAETSTEIALTPRVLRLAPGVQGGWMVGARGLSGPYGALTADVQLPQLSPDLYLRLGAGLYSTTAGEDDVQIDLSVLPLAVGASVRGARGRTSGWVGGAGVLAPYRIAARTAEQDVGGGIGLSSPGVQVFTGAAVRRRTAELGAELSWLFLTLPDGDLTWQGSVGGLGAGLSYRLMY